MRLPPYIFLFWAFTVAALAALPEEFRAVPDEEFKKELAARMVPVEKWAEETSRRGFDLLCLGETHDDFFRKFYARTTLPFLSFHALALEDSAEATEEKFAAYKKGEKYNLLGADLGPVLQAASLNNHELRVRGIEIGQAEDKERIDAQIADKPEPRPTRDGYIASHVDQLWKEGHKRVVALYGSLHCSYRNRGFASELPFARQLQKLRPQKKIVSVLVLPPGAQGGLLRVYVDSFRLALQGDMALVGPGSIPAGAYHEREELRSLLSSYDVILLPQGLPPVE